ncbi:MAG TPA: GDSL-type esterase/lipase family protein [Caulobacteraceae bacterium]|jgi:acyl-CoA thioesterase-1|nr:GDSL-type esterase/lipase family protein [Caulobacteraceae bacterium]
MGLQPPSPVTRRGILALAGAGIASQAAGARLARVVPARVVTVLGDSITAGYGLAAAAALPARLQAALAALGVAVRVRAAGVSGDTTADGLNRADFSVQPDTALCLVALGGNDLLQGLDPRVTRRNLDAIVRRLQARRIGVLVAGVRAPGVIGPGYAEAFNAVFRAVAAARHTPLYPDLLAGVAGQPRLIQHDGIHPNAAGVEVIARRLAPVVASALARRR